MKRYKHIRTHHWIVAALAISAAAWITYYLTALIVQDPSANKIKQNPIGRLIDESETDGSSESIYVEQNLDSIAQRLFDPESSAASNLQSGQGQSPSAATGDTIVEVSALESGRKIYPHHLQHRVKSGDTLDRIFKSKKFNRTLPFLISKHEVAKTLSKLAIGKTVHFYLNDEKQLKEIVYPITALEQLRVEVDGAEIINASFVPLAYDVAQQAKSGVITSSLYEAALESGVSIAHIMDMVRIFGWDIDFVLDIREGDTFHMIYEDYLINNEKVADGQLLAAEFTTQGTSYRAIQFENTDDEVSYFAPNGESMLGTFLRSPVEFSRISSRFGQRKHPILKTWRAHKGVDYAASRGTPIRSTADGKIIHAGKKGGYGNTVIVSHAGRFSTLYAHMNGFAKGIKNGVRVKQGQVVGYIGSTGLATGPHLHYEFRLDGVHRNPLTYKTPKATAVAHELRPQFNLLATSFGRELDNLNAALTQRNDAIALGADVSDGLGATVEAAASAGAE